MKIQANLQHQTLITPEYVRRVQHKYLEIRSNLFTGKLEQHL